MVAPLRPRALLLLLLVGCGGEHAGSADSSKTSDPPPRSSASASSRRPCDDVDCKKAHECRRADCAGAVVYRGCCPCEPGAVDAEKCLADAGP